MSIDIGGMVLKQILTNPSSEDTLEAWTRLKIPYFNNEFTSIYSTISRHYTKYNVLPSFNDLRVSTRDKILNSKLIALEKLEVIADVELNIAVDALVNEFAQREFLLKASKLLDTITILDAEELKHELADILLYLEEKTHSTQKVYNMNDLLVSRTENINTVQVPLGFSNDFDGNIRAETTELVMVGGMRGEGKSVFACNIVASQYELGNSVLYFSIEMKAQEPYDRINAILADVSYTNIRFDSLTEDEILRLANVTKDMFKDSKEHFEQFLLDKNFEQFEKTVKENCTLKDNQYIIIDDSGLTLADIDLNIQKYKAKFGDLLKVVVVDYVNQIQIENIYNWEQQINLSKGLKDLARKYEVLLVTPYQINAEGEARFSKGILDAADIAMTIKGESDFLKITSTKVRNSRKFTLDCPINWDTLRISPDKFIASDEDELM